MKKNTELKLDDNGAGSVSAHATVTKDDDSPQKGVSVTLKVNGKSVGAPVRVDDDGNAHKELKLKVGEESRVTAFVTGKPHVSTHEDITPAKKKRRKTTWLEWVISGIFLIAALKWSYTTFTVVGLLSAIAILFFGASIKAKKKGDDPLDKFTEMIQDNNWVYYTFFWLFIGSLVIWLIGLVGQPLPEMNPIKYGLGKLKDAVAPPPYDPYANDGLGSSITRFFLGNKGGWGSAAFTYFWWTVLAYPVSFWDDWKESRKNKGGKDDHGHGHKGSPLGWLGPEIAFELIKAVFNFLTGGKKK